MSALLSHHAAAGSLATLMSDISEEVYAAGWIEGCEWTLWDLLVGWRATEVAVWARHDITDRMPELDRLQRTADGWVWWRECMSFVEADRWRRLVAARKARGLLVPDNDVLDAEVH